jgi:hypothetical protein
LTLVSAVPAVVLWHHTLVLQAVLVFFVVVYASLYWRIVRFRAPRILVARQWGRHVRLSAQEAHANEESRAAAN